MIAIISDIHGNYPALAEVLKIIRSMHVDEVYCLGDIVGYYPQVNECCALLQKQNVKCILGNHDWYLASGTSCTRSRSANECLKYQHSIISSENRKWLSLLPVLMFRDNLSMVHGGWTNPLDEYVLPTDEQLRAIPTAFGCSGHTHKQSIHQAEGKVYCNPGSVGQPRDNDCRAAFATFNEGTFALHRVEYNIDDTCNAMESAGFCEYYYKRLRTGAANFET